MALSWGGRILGMKPPPPQNRKMNDGTKNEWYGVGIKEFLLINGAKQTGKGTVE